MRPDGMKWVWVSTPMTGDARHLRQRPGSMSMLYTASYLRYRLATSYAASLEQWNSNASSKNHMEPMDALRERLAVSSRLTLAGGQARRASEGGERASVALYLGLAAAYTAAVDSSRPTRLYMMKGEEEREECLKLSTPNTYVLSAQA